LADTITSFTQNMSEIVTSVTDEMGTSAAALSSGDVSPSSLITLMGATAKFTMALEACSGIQKAFGDACITPARKMT